jgi:dihydrofolate synthase/folylpolyglutamate synthase
VITNIGLDHTPVSRKYSWCHRFRKSRNIKPNVPVVIGEYTETRPVFLIKLKNVIRRSILPLI